MPSYSMGNDYCYHDQAMDFLCSLRHLDGLWQVDVFRPCWNPRGSFSRLMSRRLCRMKMWNLLEGQQFESFLGH